MYELENSTLIILLKVFYYAVKHHYIKTIVDSGVKV